MESIEQKQTPENIGTMKIRINENSKEVFINKNGASIIYEAYKKSSPSGANFNSLEILNNRGGMWESEIELLKNEGFLPKYFNYKEYITE